MKRAEFEKIIKFAIKNEVEAKKFYKFVASKIKDPHLGKMFAGFAEDEEKHKQMLENQLIKEATLSFIKPIDYKISENIEKPVISSEMKPSEAFALAIKNEEEAMKLYTELAAAIKDQGKKVLFQSLADMENSHKNKMEKAFIEISKLEI